MAQGMNTYTRFDDLSAEIFFEIFDYFDALQIFTSFTSLNKRISSILQSIPLRIIISRKHCRRQIEFLSSCLTSHDHQVISIDTYDTIRDYSSTISLLFAQHNFINLKSCIFHGMNPSPNLKNVIQQIKSLNRLALFSIEDSVSKNIDENDKHDLIRTILTHKSSSLRSCVLEYPYNYLNISNNTSISSNLISLNLFISGSRSTVSVYSLLSVLRLCHSIRYLRTSIYHEISVEDANVNVSVQPSPRNGDDLPILSQLVSFHLTIRAIYDSRCISCFLRCMPNLIRFYFIFGTRGTDSPFPGELVDGYVWKQMFELYVPHLSTFEFHMSIFKSFPRLDLKVVVRSFDCFVTKYSNWQMAIDRWTLNLYTHGEYIMLRTLNYQKHKSYVNTNIPGIRWDSFETQSTIKYNHHMFYSNENDLRIYMTERKPVITWHFPLFQQITYLFIHMPRKRSWLSNNLLKIDTFLQTNDVIDDDDAQHNVIYLSHFVHLPNVTELEFASKLDISRWEDIQYILEACSNVINLTISTQLLFSSKLINNPTLIPIFKRIKTVKAITEKIYFRSHFTSKLVQRFPSLIHIELQVVSFDDCVSIIDVLLSHLKELSYIKINYSRDTLLDDPFSREYIIEKRHETFPNNILDEQMINVINNGETIEIWLS